jgi:hypothetical protein
MTALVSAGVVDHDLPRIGWRAITGTVTASSAAAGYEASRAVGFETYDGWKPTALPARWDVQAAAATTASYMGVAAHDLDGYTVAPQRWLSGAWVDIAPARVISGSSAIFWLFPGVSSDRFALRIVSGPGLPVVGHIRFGSVLKVPRHATYTGDPLDEGETVRMRQNLSETGEYLGAVVEGNGLTGRLEIEHLPETFRLGEWRQFKQFAERAGTFFVAPKPNSYPGEVAYAWLAGRANVTRQIPKRDITGSVSLDIQGYARP